MGSRGPAPKPTKLKLVQGTFRPDRAAANEPTPESSAPSAPSILHQEGKREWRRIVAACADLGLLTQLDRAVLLRYCQAYEEFWKMQLDIDKRGEVQVTDTGYEAVRPAVTIRNQALARMQKAESELGLTPSARTRVSVPEQKKPAGNPFLEGTG